MVQLTAAHRDEVESLSAVVASMRLENEQAAAGVQSLQHWRHQHEIDLEKAHDIISDLRWAAQHAAAAQGALHEALLRESSSMRWILAGPQEVFACLD